MATGLPGINYQDAKFVMSLSGGNVEVAALIAFTWAAESGFSHDPPNHANPGGPTNIDIGPMQINYQTWIGEFDDVLHRKSKAFGLSVDGVFGTDIGPDGTFNGNYKANVKFGANVIIDLYGEYGLEAAGYYISKTPKVRKPRQRWFEQYKDKLINYFGNQDCF